MIHYLSPFAGPTDIPVCRRWGWAVDGYTFNVESVTCATCRQAELDKKRETEWQSRKRGHVAGNEQASPSLRLVIGELPERDPEPTCAVCRRKSFQIPELVNVAEVSGLEPHEIARDDSTYNLMTRRFLCAECWTRAGMPLYPPYVPFQW